MLSNSAAHQGPRPVGESIGWIISCRSREGKGYGETGWPVRAESMMASMTATLPSFSARVNG